MASVKRRAVTDDRPSKKVKSSKSANPSSRPLAQDKDSIERKPLAQSLLQQEERAFPRGGASVLTPLEHKQIKAQAERDVLFERQNGQTSEEQKTEEDLFKEGLDSKPAKKIKKNQKSVREGTTKAERSSVRIQGLSYKNLVVGSVVLGYVTSITSKDVALSLPNNLTGYVPITAISEGLNTRIEKLLQNEELDNDANADQEDVDLKQLFYVGQWLRATVTATGSEPTDSNSKGKKHIELSVDPAQVNGGLDRENVVVNSMVQASVRSVEDHGVVMDMGFADSSIKAFVSKKELGTAYSLDQLHEGQVMMCRVTGKGSDGKILKLSPEATTFSAYSGSKAMPSVGEAPTVDGFQPGTAVDLLIVESGSGGVVAKIMGMLDVTADTVHSGAGIATTDISQKYKIGSKTKGRIVWTLPSDDGDRRIGISLLDHMLTLPPPPSKLPENASAKLRAQAAALAQSLPLSSIVEEAKVSNVLSDRGLFTTLPTTPIHGETGANAFVHISQISDNRIDTLSSTTGSFKLGSSHRARIISYNPLDNLYYLSLKKSILDQAFLRIEDLTVGETVKGTVDRLILGAKGITGVLVKLSDSISALVPEMHLSDAQLQHPERKFKEGLQVKAKVLSVDLEKRHVRLTLKKTIVNEDDPTRVWKAYDDLKPGMESRGTIINILSNGAVAQFFGSVRAWLPVAEMSDTFIERPEQHFRLGQTVSLRIVSVNAEAQEMKVSCKENKPFEKEQQETWSAVSVGDRVSGTVTEKGAENISLDLENGLRGLLRLGHLTDNVAKLESALKKAHVGKKLSDLVVLGKLERSHFILVSKKPNLVEAASTGSLICSFGDVEEGKKVNGFVRNIAPEGIFVEFANGVVGLLPKSQITPEMAGQTAFGMTKDQSISCWVIKVDVARERFALSMQKPDDNPTSATNQTPISMPTITNPVDPSITSVMDFTIGKITKARIASVKATQINVRLADNVQGRVEVSEVFDEWDQIKNKKAPLQGFIPNAILDVKILGIHDARNHRFLPITHRKSTIPVFELSIKKSRVELGNESGLSMESVQTGDSHLAFVNNHGPSCVWVNISPNVRGRIALMDLSDDAGHLLNPSKNFPVGCALRVNVKAKDSANNRLDLITKSVEANEQLTLQNVSPGMILAGRVTKANERSVHIQLSDSLAAPVHLVEMSDDYDQLNLDQYNKNDIVRACVLDVDLSNKKLFLSLRPSKVLSSSLPVKDKQITSYAQLASGDIVRGFVKHVADKGVYVSLGATIDALVRISDLSDQYIKDWKSIVEVDQLVKGRVVAVDVDAKLVQISLKKSHVEDGYTAPITLHDLQSGMIVTGKVRKVEDFGAFIDIDNTQPRLSGLCHRSEVAAKRVEDVRKLYSAGDVVKAKVLKVDIDARKISLGLKASYFMDENGIENQDQKDDNEDVDMISVDEDEDGDLSSDGGVVLGDVEDTENQVNEDASEAEDMDVDGQMTKSTSGLKTFGFDWTGDGLEPSSDDAASESEADENISKKRKRHKPEIKIDMTGDLDKYGPRSFSDFERQLLGQPNDSGLWIQYMAFQLQLSEIQKAREIAERALRTIHIREVDEKANVWIAWLNLEVEYGDQERVEDVFKEACHTQDPLEMHEKLASIYIDSGKHDKADAIFERIVGNKTFRASPDVWLNYANFLMDTLKAPVKSRTLLSRAMQSIPINEHRLLTAKFAALEFRSPQGDAERGRTIFEGLVSEWPKWSSGWDMWVDLERSRIAHVSSGEARDEATGKVRALYERISAQKMKKRRARFIFKRWLEFEEAEGKERDVERVKARAKEYVEGLQARNEAEEEE